MRFRNGATAQTSENRGLLYNVLDVLLNVVIIVAIVAVIRTFIVSPFEVEGNSMVPTLADNQYIIINKFGYYLGEPKRGDVVVFRPPADSRKHYVKRIIGMPGDEVAIRDGRVFLVFNDKEIPLEEEYLDSRNMGKTFRAPVGTGDTEEERYRIPDGSYFLLGDNRQFSLDSRSFRNAQGEAIPYVGSESISGRVWFVAFPITKSHALQTPDYGEWQEK
jgi:signal peptidase I